MSLNFMFNNGVGPGAGGCTGQSPQNCVSDMDGCQAMPGGPIMYTKLTRGNGVGFVGMTNMQKSQFLSAQISNPLQMAKSRASAPIKTPVVPTNGVGVL